MTSSVFELELRNATSGAGGYAVFLLTDAGWFPMGSGLTWNHAHRRAEEASDEISCIVQIRDSDETIIDQIGEVISRCIA